MFKTLAIIIMELLFVLLRVSLGVIGFLSIGVLMLINHVIDRVRARKAGLI